MSIFGGGDYVDYTELKKRGLLKVPEVKNDGMKVNKDGYVEILKRENAGSNEINSVNNAQQTGGNEMASNPFGFLSSFANSASSSSSDNISNSDNLNNSNVEVAHLKVKLEDLEYKFDRLMEKLNLIEDKMAGKA